MTILRRYDNNGIELGINTETGESFATVFGYARMANRHWTTISKRINRNNLILEMTEIQTKTGLKPVTLINEDLICEWIVEDNLVIATQMLKLGVRAYLHTVAGFDVNSTVDPKLPQTYEEAVLEASRVVLELEKSEQEKKILKAQDEDLE